MQTAFQAFFQFKALLFVEEMASILLTPFVLYFSLPACAGLPPPSPGQVQGVASAPPNALHLRTVAGILHPDWS